MKNKQKTNKSCAKRFRKTARGHYLRKQGGIKHINTKMAAKRKRKLRRSALVPKSYEPRLDAVLHN
jgi:large subunit ribosomal protein L35